MNNSKNNITTVKRNQTLENSLKLIRTAIKKRISVSEASSLAGYGKTYVSDVKKRLNTRLSNKTITKTDVKEFNTLYNEYVSVVK